MDTKQAKYTEAELQEYKNNIDEYTKDQSINHKFVIAEGVEYTGVAQKTFQSEKEKGEYCTIPLIYNLGALTNTERRVINLDIELPEMKSTYGLQEKQTKSFTKDGKPIVERSIGLEVNLLTPEGNSVVECLDNRLYNGCVKIVETTKGTTKLKNFMIDLPDKTGFRKPLFYKTGPDGSPIKGRNPTLYLKVGYNTVFYDLSGNTINVEFLKQSVIKMIPLVSAYEIYVSSTRAHIKCRLLSAVVTFIQDARSINRQLGTIKKFSNDTEAVNTVNQQLAHIIAVRGDPTSVKIIMNSGADSDGAPTFSGIKPTNGVENPFNQEHDDDHQYNNVTRKIN